MPVGFRTLLLMVISGFIFSFSISCRKDLDFEPSQSTLRFSKDTVFLDTIFTQSNSETYLLKVYNDSDENISLSNVYLNRRSESPFRINVDGVPGFEFSEIPLRANDSLMVFVEIAMSDSGTDFIQEDELIFSDSGQQVKLLAMAENAVYHYPAENEEFLLLQDTEWNSSTSHVIYGNVKLAEGRTMNVHPGTRIYLHNGSSLEILSNATLNLNGTRDNPVLIRGARHDARYDSLPGQWEHIKLLNADLNANYAVIKGGKNGLNLENSTAEMHNMQIYNMSSSGIFAKNATIHGTNVVISDAADACLNVEKGGNYNFYYSTFANNWESGVSGISGPNIPAYLSDYTTVYDANGVETGQEYAPLNAFFANSIFYGRYWNGVYLDAEGETEFNYDFQHCLIKNEDTSVFDFSPFNVITENPMFISTIFSQQDLRLQEDSPARNAGNSAFNQQSPQDIRGVQRDQSPNIGAYE